MIRVLYDGWSAVYQPNSPPAIHLLTLLQQHHPEVESLVALPGEPPSWLPGDVILQVSPAANTPKARLVWEQRKLPRLAQSLGAQLLHLTSATPPLLTRLPVVVSPAGFPSPRLRGVASRLREAFASGGLTRLQGLFWPLALDVPPQSVSAPIFRLPAEPYPDIAATSSLGSALVDALELPETYILYHGPCHEDALQRLLQAWSWVSGPVGEYYPLLLLGLDARARQLLPLLATEYGLQGTVRLLPDMHPGMMPALVQSCSALFHPAPLVPWGGAAQLALFYGRPLVAVEEPLMSALTGPAAYLAPEGDSRALGAALLTVIVEEQVAESLGEAGRQRSVVWDTHSFGEALFAAYQAVISQT
jgi:glycosyltransferase involved in cell wall biosynthesis